jgi:hypothetical protein
MDYQQIVDALRAMGVPAAGAVLVAALAWAVIKAMPFLRLRPSDEGTFRAHLMSEVESLRRQLGKYFDELVECKDAHAKCSAETTVLRAETSALRGEIAQIKERLRMTPREQETG